MLLVIVSEADENRPATVTIHSDTEFVDEVGNPYPNQPFGEATGVHGPWVVCFTSPLVVEAIRADEFLRALLLENASIRELPADRIFGFALAEGARVIIDPFMGSGGNVSLDQPQPSN